MLRAGLRLLIKDALRGARYTVRQSTRAPVPIDFPGRRHLTRIADDVLSQLEEAVVNLRYGSDLADDMIRTSLPDVAALAAPFGRRDFPERFAAASYRLSKGILARRGVETIYGSELLYTTAGRKIVGRALRSDNGWSPAQFAAEITLALIETAPIRSMPTDRNPTVFQSETNSATAFTLGLAVAAWRSKAEGLSALDYVDSAGDIVAAAFPRLVNAQSAADPVAALEAIFTELAAFVP